MSNVPNVVQEVNDIFIFIIGVDVFLLALITFLMIYFVIKYNKKRHPKAEKVKEHPMLEIMWTVTPTILVLGMFYYGYIGYRDMRIVPKGAMTVKVLAAQWQWRFQYANGKISDELYVPIKKPVKLILHSNDVIHGFYVPAFRIKRDVVPGMDNYVWFQADKVCKEQIMCTQYCGLYHAQMLSNVVAVKPADFEKWYNTKETTDEKGEPKSVEPKGSVDTTLSIASTAQTKT